MKNNCDVRGKRTYCKIPEMALGGYSRIIECDHRDKTDDETCTFRDKRGSCSSLAAIRDAIKTEADHIADAGKMVKTEVECHE